jgi:hypothetical protein
MFAAAATSARSRRRAPHWSHLSTSSANERGRDTRAGLVPQRDHGTLTAFWARRGEAGHGGGGECRESGLMLGRTGIDQHWLVGALDDAALFEERKHAKANRLQELSTSAFVSEGSA